MANIIFNYENFYNWYDVNLKNTTIFENAKTIFYYKFKHGISENMDVFKKFIYLSEKYGNYLNVLNKSPSDTPLFHQNGNLFFSS